MKEIVLTRGLPGSGKTTWARRWVAESPDSRARCNRDDLRFSLFASYQLPFALEEAVTEVQRGTVAALLARGMSVAVDDMHLRPRYAREWIRFGRAHSAEVRTVEMPVDVDLAVSRDMQRDRTVGEEVIRALAAKYMPRDIYLPIPPVEDAQPISLPYSGTEGKPAAVMVDIDGTVALMGSRSPYDLTRVHEDEANAAVISAVQAAHASGMQVVFCSGREDSAREPTQGWLIANTGIEDFLLLMRAAGDKRRDSVVKAELFDKHIRYDYDVKYVLDDRQQVVDMWRSLGLTVFQVAPGDF